MITFTQKEVEDLIDSLLKEVELSGRSGEGLFLAHKKLVRRLRSKVNEQLEQFKKEWGQGPFGDELTPETILYPVPPHSTEPEVD